MCVFAFVFVGSKFLLVLLLIDQTEMCVAAADALLSRFRLEMASSFVFERFKNEEKQFWSFVLVFLKRDRVRPEKHNA